MDFDFHYYGTYTAARMAGFLDDKAKEIAIAAQFVDEFHEDRFAKIMAKNLPQETPCYTAFKLNNNWDAVCSAAHADATLAKIWVPYHFMPVNMLGDAITIGDETHCITNKDAKTYQCLIAGPYGDLYDQVMDLKGVAADDTMAIGLKMHVLADTYAHQGFVGIRQEDINGVENAFEVYDNTDKQYKSSFYIMQFGAIGHGDLGHNPDIGYIVVKYKPHWNNKECVVSRNNIKIFSLAFKAMFCALYKINYNSTASQKQAEDAMLEALKIVSVASVAQSGSEFQELQWLNYIMSQYSDAYATIDDVNQQIIKDKESIVSYFDSHFDKLKAFNAAAQNHYNMVQDSLPAVVSNELLSK